ncbi:MAG: GFA family protein [Rhizomicrobium sp.]
MIQASCHCGLITLEIEAAPSVVTDCNCSICRRYGALWAYYAPKQVRVRSGGADTETYMWGDKSLMFHRCPVCGCVSHWSAADPALGRMGVNVRLMPPQILAKARIRHLDGAVTEQYLD